MDPAIERSRQLREAILRVLLTHDQSGLALGYSAHDLGMLMMDPTWGTDFNAVGSEIRTLRDRKLIVSVDGTNPPRFILTADGKDFCLASYPWAEIDRFTGKQRA